MAKTECLAHRYYFTPAHIVMTTYHKKLYRIFFGNPPVISQSATAISSTHRTLRTFWSQLKRGYVGIYHYMSLQHLHRCCNEFAKRYNVRDSTNIARVLFVISNGSNRERITCRELTPNKPDLIRKERYRVLAEKKKAAN